MINVYTSGCGNKPTHVLMGQEGEEYDLGKAEMLGYLDHISNEKIDYSILCDRDDLTTRMNDDDDDEDYSDENDKVRAETTDLDDVEEDYLDDNDVGNVEEEEEIDTGGVKNDVGKAMFTCLPSKALMELGRVAELGARKYGLHNYRKGLKLSRTLDAGMRHLLAAMDGEKNDQVDGNDHLISTAWNCLVAYQMLIEHPELDDRYKGDE